MCIRSMKVLQISAAGMIMTVTLHLHLWFCVCVCLCDAVQTFVFFQCWEVLMALRITVFCTEFLSIIWYPKQKTVFQKLDFVASSGDKIVSLLSAAWYKGCSHSLAKMC